MVRSSFVVLLCCAFLFSLALNGHADGGAPKTDGATNSSNSNSNAGTSGAGSSSQVVSNPFLFIDVPADHWAVDDLKFLVEYGVITGLPNGAFNGDSYLTRYSATAMMARAMRLTMNNPDQLNVSDLDAVQQLLFELSEQVEQNRLDIDSAPSVSTTDTGQNPVRVETDPSIELRLNQLTQSLDDLKTENVALQQEMAQLKQATGGPQPNITQMNQLRQRANVNFIVAVSALFVGILGVGVAIMT